MVRLLTVDRNLNRLLIPKSTVQTPTPKERLLTLDTSMAIHHVRMSRSGNPSPASGGCEHMCSDMMPKMISKRYAWNTRSLALTCLVLCWMREKGRRVRGRQKSLGAAGKDPGYERGLGTLASFIVEIYRIRESKTLLQLLFRPDWRHAFVDINYLDRSLYPLSLHEPIQRAVDGNATYSEQCIDAISPFWD